MSANCSSCTFSASTDPGHYYPLLCLRYPPTPVPTYLRGGLDVDRTNSLFPPVNTNDWCGEYKVQKEVPSGG